MNNTCQNPNVWEKQWYADHPLGSLVTTKNELGLVIKHQYHDVNPQTTLWMIKQSCMLECSIYEVYTA